MGKITAYCLLIILSLAACEQKKKSEALPQVPYYNTADFTPTWTIDKKVIDTLHRIRDFHFIDQYGHTISRDTFAGKIYLTNFFFTSCTNICPRMTENMKRIYEKFKGNPSVMFLSHSVSPHIDSTERLYNYAKSKGVLSSQWRFVHGDLTDIYDIARRSYYVEEYLGLNKDSTEFLHTEKFVLIDRQGHIRGLYNGTTRTEISRICDDINYLLKEE